jgi:hypothetical protein
MLGTDRKYPLVITWGRLIAWLSACQIVGHQPATGGENMFCYGIAPK